MDQSVMAYLKARPDLLRTVRKQPIWYRYLSRNPSNIQELEKVVKQFYGKNFTGRVEKLNENVQMITMLVQLIELMNE